MLPFPTPPAVQELLDDLTEGGLEPTCQLGNDGSITIEVRTGRVRATGVFVRGKKGYRLSGRGRLQIDGRAVPGAQNPAHLRQIIKDPDEHLLTHPDASGRRARASRDEVYYMGEPGNLYAQRHHHW